MAPVPSSPAQPAAALSDQHDGQVELICSPQLDLPRVERPRMVYLIASQPRTGSNLLCSLLSQSGVAGMPTEYVHPHATPTAIERGGFADMDAFLADAMTRRTTPNGVFGIKMHYGQLEWFLRETKAGFPLGLRAVRLFRRDVVAQGISLYLAQQTGLWAATQRHAAALPAVDYDFNRIARTVGAVLKEHNRWTAFFRKAGAAPRAMAYETLTADPPAAALRVLDWLGIAGDPAVLRQATLPPKLGNARNAEWAARFRAEAAARGMSPPPA